MGGHLLTPEIETPHAPSPLWRFSLAELMFFMTIAAFCFTCWAIHFFFGICVSILVIPATFRAMAENRLTVQAGFVPSLIEKVLALLVSCTIVFLALLDYALLIGLMLFVLVMTNAFLIPRELHGVASGFAALIAIGLLRKPFRLLKETWPR